jgi:cyclohexa-1,5-dienecarbonyl-CoA hydratase
MPFSMPLEFPGVPLDCRNLCYSEKAMDEPDPIQFEVSPDAARLTLRRPPLNFLTVHMLRRVEECLESLGTAPPCRVLVIDSEVGAFSAGFDPTELTKDGVFLLLDQFHRVVIALHHFTRPTIAVVRGMAVGAGNELAISCDFVLASHKSMFGNPEIKVGAIPSLAHILLPPLVGQRRATDLILTGTLIGARDAQEFGMIQSCIPEEKLTQAVEDLVKGFGSVSLPVLEVALQAVRQSRVQALSQHVREAESIYLDQLMETEDQSEGVQAFLEKRPPRWKNR